MTAKKLHPHAIRYILRALEIYESTGQPKFVACAQQPVEYPLLLLGLRRDQDDTKLRISQRIDEMIYGGLEHEVQ